MDKTRPIIALDVSQKEDLESLLRDLGGEPLSLKIGMELYFSQGPAVVRDLLEAGHQVFLDLKLHDIPNTVARTVSFMSQLGCQMINVHAQGGIEMMRAAVNARNKSGFQPLLIAVTQLTSTSPKEFKRVQNSNRTLTEDVLHLAKLAKESGMDGVVCSPQEVPAIKEACGVDFLTITPGIRWKWSPEDDQKRVTTAESAKKRGTDYIVVGRPITRADNRRQIYQAILQEWRAS
ncbi:MULTISPECIES: orotidine-5'-phosphate decarboxylase [unclassified Streptococcus]|uniref:orotidine-5'-phosphate decarboxylase n=1 Tax=unclassified Streptococcus TaxID=2608887 RepID=UPI001071D296|nr:MULTISPECIES: orotidine-5'-phosphate decarboxylase [unclassified Streptococcus]MBF0805723.1 orotidine-5'-phosphate decarboxylase [Streptococcus sp. 19428wA2_WM07]TFU28703.1 orotidine-5'-phosphate decarboxylase [Streptococcus sp. WM07]